MKKKYRDIIVNDTKYVWSFDGESEDYIGSFIKIWFNKKVIYNEFHKNVIKVVPKYIRELILTKIIK